MDDGDHRRAAAQRPQPWRHDARDDAVQQHSVARLELPQDGSGVEHRQGKRATRDGQEVEVAVWRGLPAAGSVLVRLHSECLTGDVLGSARCDCGIQLEASLRRLARARSGLLIYLHQEGRGIGLADKIRAYALQDRGLDTVDANTALGLPVDARDYSSAAAVLRQLGVQRVRLLTNNPAKRRALEEQGIEVAERVPLETAPTPVNLGYLRTKRDRMG